MDIAVPFLPEWVPFETVFSDELADFLGGFFWEGEDDRGFVLLM